MENTGARPILEPITKPEIIEGTTKISETVSKQQEHFNLGRKVEKQVLDEMKLDKNTETFEFKDPKTGKMGRTIPDAMTKDGGTVEVKHVAKQSFTKQLRGQLEISKSNGAEALLKINKTAELSEPLKKSGINIERYLPLKPKTDNTNVNINPPAAIRPIPQKKNPCAGIPNCI